MGRESSRSFMNDSVKKPIPNVDPAAEKKSPSPDTKSMNQP